MRSRLSCIRSPVARSPSWLIRSFSCTMVTPILITLAITLPLLAAIAWMQHRHAEFVKRVASIRRNAFTVASLACGLPCSGIALFVLWVEFLGAPNYDVVGVAMAVAYYYLFALPVALLALVLAFFAKRYRGLCFANAAVYAAVAMLIFW